ncbi:MAG TPA: hypothetical protein VLT83_06300 [Opitutaceae bacterium]|nr:hypothetical protein [Opitutaceae bacterium]
MEVRFEDFPQNGLYLLFPDGRRIALTRERIESFARLFESNLDQLPADVRTAAAFRACPVCPEKERAKFCHALPATLAFVEELKGFRSYDKVCAVYRAGARSLVWVPETTMQEALQFVAILSLMYYCEVGRQYWRFFLGIHPLLDARELITRLHLNIFWDCRGDQQKVDQILRAFGNDITCTCRCQVDRLALVCKEEALMNAFVNTQAQIETLATSKGALLERSFAEFLQNS